MDKSINNTVVHDELVLRRIYVIRDVKVMLDRDLAELYGVETKYLKRQVKGISSAFRKISCSN